MTEGFGYTKRAALARVRRRYGRPRRNPRLLTVDEADALRAVRKAERAALAGMRDLADFDRLVFLSDALCEADRVYRCARRRALRGTK